MNRHSDTDHTRLGADPDDRAPGQRAVATNDPSSAPYTAASVPAAGIRVTPPKYRGLLALVGDHLTPEILRKAQIRCLQLMERVDILLVNPPNAPTSRLSDLLISLENSNTDYRLTLAYGNPVDQIIHYLGRFLGIKLVIMDVRAPLELAFGTRITNLCRRGYRFVPLAGLAGAA
jgi:hypothetical protein